MGRSYSKSTWYKEMKSNLDTVETNCIYCGERLIKETFTVDHIELYSNGGAGTEENCKPCCKFCNSLRGDTDYNKFISDYPKEKILKLKKYTTSNINFEVAGVEYMENLSNKLGNIQNDLAEILKDRKELSEMVSTYSKLDNQISKEIVYSDNLNASQGYNLYVKKREVGRQLEKYRSQLAVISKVGQDLNSALLLIENKKHSIDDKIANDKYAKERPILKNIENIIDNKIKNDSSTNNKHRTYKIYKFAKDSSSHHKKNQYKQLCQIWKNVEADEINKVYKCSFRK